MGQVSKRLNIASFSVLAISSFMLWLFAASLSSALVPKNFSTRPATRSDGRIVTFMVTNKLNVNDEPVQPGRIKSGTRAIKRAVKRIFFTAVPDDQRRDGMTDDEILSIVYNNIDKDGDGVLTREELEASGISATTLDALDFDKTGTIKKWEFQRGLQTLQGGLNTGASDSYQMIDDLDDTIGELIPLEREDLRLGGFEPYILVSVLTAQTSFNLIGRINLDWNAVMSKEWFLSANWAKLGLLTSCGITTLSGIYAAVVFSLTILYGKTALGMEKDEEYRFFMDNTGLQRFRAFRAFSLALFGFSFTVMFQICDAFPESHARLLFLIASSAILLFFKQEYDSIMTAAAPMFKTVEEANTECYLDDFDPATGDCGTKSISTNIET